MAGSKRNKLKKVLSPASPPPPPNTEDDQLVDDLLAHLDARDANVQQEANEILNEMEMNKDQEQLETAKKDSRSRFKARELRKAAARAVQQAPASDDEAAGERIRRETEEEHRTIRGICDAQGLEIYEINPDGHCLFAAVADQLALLSVIPAKNANYYTTRLAAADYIASHPDEFLPFLPSADGEDGSGATEAGLMSPQDFQKYCAAIRDTGAWGGEPEILAMARAFNVSINIVQWGSPSVVVHSPSPTAPTDRAVRISYHRRMYGLGEHYNSLRPKRIHLPTPIRNLLS